MLGGHRIFRSVGWDDIEAMRKVADSVMVPEFVPKQGVSIQSDPKAEEKERQQQRWWNEQQKKRDKSWEGLPAAHDAGACRRRPCPPPATALQSGRLRLPV